MPAYPVSKAAFPEVSRPLLTEWRSFAQALASQHIGLTSPYGSRDGLDGLGEPVGPRKWSGDFGPDAFKAFAVYFLPVDIGDRGIQPANINLSAEFSLTGHALIRANGYGSHIEMSRNYVKDGHNAFRLALDSAARFVGLLPESAGGRHR